MRKGGKEGCGQRETDERPGESNYVRGRDERAIKICLDIVPNFKGYLCFSTWKPSPTGSYKIYLLPRMCCSYVCFSVST